MKKLRKLMYAAFCGIIMTMGFVACGDKDDDNDTPPQEEFVGYKPDSNWDYMSKLVGKWYSLETGQVYYDGINYNHVALTLITLNSDYTWSKISRHRWAKDNYVETIPGSDYNGNFTLESNNIIPLTSSGTKYATWNFSTEALKVDILRIVVKYDGSTSVENEEYLPFNYNSEEDFLNEYIAKSGLGSGGSGNGGNGNGGNGNGGNDNGNGNYNSDPQWGKVTGTIKAYGTSYSAVARNADGKSTTVDYVYYPTTNKYYVYGGVYDSNSSANGGKGVRYDAKKGYNSIRINGGAVYDSSTKTRQNWELYLQVILP